MTDFEEFKSQVYVHCDATGNIVHCEGGYTIGNIADFSDWILIDEGNGDRYNLCQSHYFDGGLYTDDGIPKYKLVDGSPVKRTFDEIESDRLKIPVPEKQPTVAELNAKIAALTTSNQFLEECLVEMAGVVYA